MHLNFYAFHLLWFNIMFLGVDEKDKGVVCGKGMVCGEGAGPVPSRRQKR